jgi:hypothetical protein
MAFDAFSTLYTDLALNTLSILFSTAVFWMPILLTIGCWNLWILYVRKKYIIGQDTVLLEVLLPADIKKSPKAMEAVFSGIHSGPGETTWFDTHVLGKSRPWWSLELVSIDGTIHFYIWTRKFFKNMVEAQIYGQYPEVEIHELEEDYSRFVKFEEGKTSVWGCDFKLSKPDPYPIKTYIDYGLDAEGVKDEEKVDPMASVLEYLGNIGRGEQIWFQILIQQTKDNDRREPGSWFRKRGWKDEGKELVEELREKTIPNPTAKFPGFPNPTKVEMDIMTAIERSLSKHGFDVGIRGIYISEADKFDPSNIVGMIASFKHYSSNNLNGFKPTRWMIPFDYPWQDFKQIRQNRRRRLVLNAYRKRSWFHPPHKTPSYVLNTEELATIFHFPGGVAKSPGIQRISSRRGDAPSNLPR